MTLTAIVPALVCLAGLLVYALTKGKVETLGLWAYVCGLLVSLFVFAGHVVKL